jgi:hypothetical protein
MTKVGELIEFLSEFDPDDEANIGGDGMSLVVFARGGDEITYRGQIEVDGVPDALQQMTGGRK